jgi:predicted secreted hydrolase
LVNRGLAAIGQLRRAWLAKAGLVLSGVGLAPRAGAGSSAVQRGRHLVFPRDHGAHLEARTEWWYLTGVLRTEAQALWGFQITFFRSRTGIEGPADGRLVPRQLLFAHAALSEVASQRHGHDERITRWNGLPSAAPDAPVFAAAATDTTAVHIGRWFLRRDGGDAGRLQLAAVRDGGLAAQQFSLRLQLQRQQPLLLQGQAGFSSKGPQEVYASHYYTEPQLRAQGEISLGGGSLLRVSGSAWLDHEWSDALLHPEALGWDWIGINLHDGSALTAFQLRRADGSALWAGGSWRAAGLAEARNFGAAEVRWQAERHWRSPATGARYPVAWRIDTPAGSFVLNAVFDAQELDARRSTGTIYWEGLSRLLDGGGRELGLGYLEMTGYAGRLQL